MKTIKLLFLGLCAIVASLALPITVESSTNVQVSMAAYASVTDQDIIDYILEVGPGVQIVNGPNPKSGTIADKWAYIFMDGDLWYIQVHVLGNYITGHTMYVI